MSHYYKKDMIPLHDMISMFVIDCILSVFDRSYFYIKNNNLLVSEVYTERIYIEAR